MYKRTKALQIPPAVKRIVHDRDGGCCILCGRPGDPVAHYIARAQGGLGIAENVVTLCGECHRRYDQTADRAWLRERIASYLRAQYPDWEATDLIYRKGGSH